MGLKRRVASVLDSRAPGVARRARRLLGSETHGLAPSAAPGYDAAADLEKLRGRLELRERELARLRSEAAGERASFKPENVVWVFGSGRTGSTWLAHMFMDLDGFAMWGEPLVGKLFADLYYGQTGRLQGKIAPFILSEQHKETWLRSIRSFVLDGAAARFPEAAREDGYLLISEPNGSTGAPLLTEALPESRVVFLVRDPRDVVASFLAASRKGGWLGERWNREQSLADTDPDTFVRQRAHTFAQHAGRAWEAYRLHGGPKALVRYEELRADALGTMKRLLSDLGVPYDEAELRRVVEKHSWERIPAEKKGEGKFFRKATPGGWREDLTPAQVKTVEEIAAPIIEEFYPARREAVDSPES